jgi:hypothetical protein
LAPSLRVWRSANVLIGFDGQPSDPISESLDVL